MLTRIFSIFFAIVFFHISGHRGNSTQTPTINLEFFESIPENISNAFLHTLFNSSLADVKNMVENFKFCSADIQDLKFLVYTKNVTEFFDMKTSTKKLNMDFSTKILIHGWFGSGSNEFIKKIAKQYHKRGKYNVIGVDWSKHSKKDYISSSCTTRDIGRGISEFIFRIIQGDSEKLSRIHLIGHSLGAQVAAFTGQNVQKLTGNKIGRITGLDAAAPLFEFPIKLPKHLRLDSEDAIFVDGIHTNMGFFGFTSSYGTVDFFVDNGILVQPGCKTINIFEDLVCSHGRAVDLYQESITSKELVGVECPNPLAFHIGLCSERKRMVMGEEINTTAQGTFYLETHDKSPFGKG